VSETDLTVLGRIRAAEWNPTAPASTAPSTLPTVQPQAPLPVPDNASLASRSYFLADFAVLHAKLEALAAAIPEDKYGWRPGEGTRSFAEVFQHVLAEHYGGVMMSFGVHRDTIAAILADARALQQSASKSDVVRTLKQSGAGVRLAVEGIDSTALVAPLATTGRPRNVLRASLNVTAVLHEHLGQLIAYARSVGVVPPWSNF
jgi:hypothetical protein